MPRPRVTFSRNGTTSSGLSGPPKETSRRASYGVTSRDSVGGAHRSIVPYAREAMFTRYRTVLAHPGALRFSLTAFVARLPISIDTLGIVLLVTGIGGSYGLAGGAVGDLHHRQRALLGRAGPRSSTTSASPGCSRWSRPCSPSASWAWSPWLESGGPDGLAFLCGALAGASYPPIGSAVRARWSFVLAGRPVEVQTAYALESVVDEAIFIVGPTVATVLATQWHPWSALGLAPGHRRARHAGPRRSSAARSRPRSARRPTPAPGRRCRGCRSSRWPSCAFALGSMFAAAEVSTIAFSAEQHAKPYAGVLLASWALGQPAGRPGHRHLPLDAGRRRSGCGSARGAGAGDGADVVHRLDGRHGDRAVRRRRSRSRPTLIATMRRSSRRCRARG